MRKGPLAAILCIVVLVGILGILAQTTGLGTGQAVPAPQCGQKVIQYLNANVVQQGTAVSLVSAVEDKGLDRVTVLYQSQQITLYATKDCSLLFTNVLNMSGSGSSRQAASQAAVKSARPVADLYVMAFCPYGTQAEEAMVPVENLLGNKADIRIRFITTVSGTTAGSVESLHGSEEAREDLRQACIQEKNPALYWKYLATFDTRCYPLWQNTTALDACRANVTRSLGLQLGDIETCAFGSDGIALLKTDETDANANGATASPTLYINGVEYSGSRSPEAFKEAVCGSFDTPPAECGTALPSSENSPTSGCG
ncbi:MAG TPA: thioredoxin domain-containing protein [Methanomicrobiales archaeon]|nr:thioredoxin domain-containing protein [Methanomicrobiales archaeon]